MVVEERRKTRRCSSTAQPNTRIQDPMMEATSTLTCPSQVCPTPTGLTSSWHWRAGGTYLLSTLPGTLLSKCRKCRLVAYL